MALRPRATEQEAETARRYDFTIVEVERGVDLLALAELMATLRDWFVICQSSVPVVYVQMYSVAVGVQVREIINLKTGRQHAGCDDQVRNNEARHAEGKEDWLSSVCHNQPCNCSMMLAVVPGCSVESTTFFACHISGVIDLISPCLYEETSFFAFSRPALETKRVLRPWNWSQHSYP